MKNKIIFSIGIFTVCFLLLPLAFAQNETQSAALQQSAPSDEVLWVWGEVKAIDQGQSAITVSYIDYQTEEDKELIISVPADTKFENIPGISGLKVGDTVSVDYVTKDGKNTTKHISVEKIEDIQEGPATQEQPTPAQPAQ